MDIPWNDIDHNDNNFWKNRKGEIRIINGTKIIQHGDDFITINGNVRCTNGDCPGNIENCEYRKQRNDAFIGYTFDGIRWWKENGSLLTVWQSLAEKRKLMPSFAILRLLMSIFFGWKGDLLIKDM